MIRKPDCCQHRHKPFSDGVLCLLLLITTTACQSTPTRQAPAQARTEIASRAVADAVLLPRHTLQDSRAHYALAVSPSGQTLVTGGAQYIELLDVAQGHIQQKMIPPGDVVSLAFSPDESLLAAGGKGGTTLWDTQNGNKVARLSEPKHYVTALAFSPDGLQLATGHVGEQTEITLWHITHKKEEITYRYETPYADNLHTLHFSPDGQFLAAAGRDQRIRLWAAGKTAAKTSPVQTLSTAGMNPSVLAFSPDANTLAVGTLEGPIFIYDWRRSAIIGTLQGHQGAVQSLAFQNQGLLLVSAGQDQSLRHWHVKSGQNIKTEQVDSKGTLLHLAQNANTLVVQGRGHTDFFALDAADRRGPNIVIHTPGKHEIAFSNTTRLQGKVMDDAGLSEVSIQINNIIWASNTGQATRDLRPVLRAARTREVQIDEQIPLRAGENILTITARNIAGFAQSTRRVIQYAPERGKVWAAVIGISRYQHVAGLRYADADARAFYDYLVNENHIPKNQVTLLLNEDATLLKLRDVLGVELPKKARKQDTVIIYYAGHGAPEPDRGSDDGDGLEKYLLPYDADPNRLYSTAFPMSEIARIFPRLAAERVVMLQDTCFSGTTALKGRTIQTAMFRASLSDQFLNRLTQGKGRVIITASEANEVSLERDDFGHGVFTHFLLESLRHGDIDGDGLITTNEAFRYVSQKVPDATGQNQHPVKKGIESAEIILGKARTGR